MLDWANENKCSLSQDFTHRKLEAIQNNVAHNNNFTIGGYVMQKPGRFAKYVTYRTFYFFA